MAASAKRVLAFGGGFFVWLLNVCVVVALVASVGCVLWAQGFGLVAKGGYMMFGLAWLPQYSDMVEFRYRCAKRGSIHVVLSADTTDVLSADTTDVSSADTTDILSVKTKGISQLLLTHRRVIFNL